MRNRLARALLSIRSVFSRSAFAPNSVLAFIIAIAVSGCGMAPTQNGGITTASLRPQQPLAQKPNPPYAPVSTAGASMMRPVPIKKAAAALPPRTFKTYQYKWNGNHERIKAGGAVQPVATAALVPATSASGLTWKASPTGAQPAVRARAKDARTADTRSRDIVVAPGDTLFSLSSKHNVSMASLMQANHLASPLVKVSQHLVLPATSR